jgi:hypothetical protein
VHDPIELRERSTAAARELGFPEPPVHFPVLWEVGEGYSTDPRPR